MRSELVLQKLHGSFKGLFQEPGGLEIWQCLTSPESIIKSECAAYLGKSPLDALTSDLLELSVFKNNQDKKRVDRFKQLTGSLVRILMEDLGYKLNISKQKLKPSTPEKPQLFTTVSTYSKKTITGGSDA